MATFFSKLFTNKKDEVRSLGIDIGSSAIKVVELSVAREKAVLNTYGSIALGPYDGKIVGSPVRLPVAKTAEALLDVVRESKAISHKAGVAIPFSSSLVSVIPMPDVNERQLQTMIPIEARKYIPVPIQEVELDWSIIPAPENSEAVRTQQILLIAIHKEALERHTSIIQSAKIEPTFFEIEMFSSFRGVLNGEKETTAVLDCGASFTKLFLVENGVIHRSHTIGRGSYAVTQAISRARGVSLEDAEVLKRETGLNKGESSVRDEARIVIDHILSEAKTLLQAGEKELGRPVDSVVLLGGGANLKGLQEVAQDVFKKEVRRGNPFTKVEAPAFLKNTLAEVGPEFAVALGCAFRGLGE